MPEDGRIKFETNETEVVLNCQAAKKSDEGKYNVTLKNSKGSTTVTISVLVMGTTTTSFIFRCPHVIFLAVISLTKMWVLL